jgi:RNA polymerase sigma-70 factor, ECF subfamily
MTAVAERTRPPRAIQGTAHDDRPLPRAPGPSYHRPLGPGMTSPATTPAVRAPQGADPESRSWVNDLAGEGPRHEQAAARLHDLLLHAARFEISRRRASLSHLRGDDFDDLAHHAAADAMVAILRKLGDYRGDSRFTTWAYKFALLEAAVKLRRRAWQGRELPLAPERWSAIEEPALSPGGRAEQSELLGLVRDAIESELSPRQREVLIAVALNGVPIDVLAERMDTTRGALYKSIHDARKKLRVRLEQQGVDFDREEER